MATEDVVRVTRVIEYVGPRAWVEQSIANSVVRPFGPAFHLSKDRLIREVSVSEPEILPPVRRGEAFYPGEHPSNKETL